VASAAAAASTSGPDSGSVREAGDWDLMAAAEFGIFPVEPGGMLSKNAGREISST